MREVLCFGQVLLSPPVPSAAQLGAQPCTLHWPPTGGQASSSQTPPNAWVPPGALPGHSGPFL